MNKEYKTFEELKEELGDKFEEFMYKANIELLDKVNQLETNIDEAIEHIQKGIDNEEYNCGWERSWIEIQEDEKDYFIDDYFTKSIQILERGKE